MPDVIVSNSTVHTYARMLLPVMHVLSDSTIWKFTGQNVLILIFVLVPILFSSCSICPWWPVAKATQLLWICVKWINEFTKLINVVKIKFLY